MTMSPFETAVRRECWRLADELAAHGDVTAAARPDLATFAADPERALIAWVGGRWKQKSRHEWGIANGCADLADMLVEKNRDYGNSAIQPVRVWSTASPDEQIRVRLDDKLSRLARGNNAGEDVEADLLGYLVLLRIVRAAP